LSWDLLWFVVLVFIVVHCLGLVVWKLKEKVVKNKDVQKLAEKVSSATGVNTKWKEMRNACLKTTEEVCGWSKNWTQAQEDIVVE
jgi:hypothetical protein